MIKVAIAGNIACGKTVVEKILKEQGYEVLDTDMASHEILEDSYEVLKLFEVNGYDILDCGEISRKKIADIVFTTPNMKKKLEDIIHPQVTEKILEFFEKYADKEVAFVAIPQLFEAKMEKFFDKIVFIYADDEIRLERLMQRNQYTKDYALLRMSAQLPQDEKIKKADVVIYNNSTIDELKDNVLNSIAQIR